MTKRDTIEQALFTWEVSDMIDEGVYYFNDITLVVDIGEHKKGTKFSSATILFSQSVLQLYQEGDTPEDYEISLTVGKRIP